MINVLIQAGKFIVIIFMGFMLRKKGFFKETDFPLIAKIVLNITLPATIINSFAGKAIDYSLLSLGAISLFIGLTHMACGYLLFRNKTTTEQAFGIVNLSGYNLGSFTLPFVQTFLGEIGIITLSLFDLGNAGICLGGSYSIAEMIKNKEKFSIKKIISNLSKSVPFVSLIIVLTLNVLNIRIPYPVLSIIEVISSATPFLAMLMIGVGFRLADDRSQLNTIVKILVTRYSLATVFSLLLFNFLPFSFEVRRTLLVILFAPIASAVPAFTNKMKGDVGLSSSINSLSIVCSIICIVTILIVTS